MNYNQCTSALENQTGNVCKSNSKSICNENDCSHCDKAASDNILDAEEHVDNFQATSDFSQTDAEESDLFKKHFGSLSSTNKVSDFNRVICTKYLDYLWMLTFLSTWFLLELH